MDPMERIDGEEASQSLPPKALIGAVEEYRSLRAEIAETRRARLLVLGFSVIALGTLAGFAGRTAGDENSFSILLTGLVISVLLAASLVFRDYTRRIELIADYLARYVEPALGSAWWERRQLQLRNEVRTKGVLNLDESTVTGVLYGLAAIAAVGIWAFSPINHPAYGYLVLIVLAAAVVVVALDLALGTAERRGWDALEEHYFNGTARRPRLAALPFTRAGKLDRSRELMTSGRAKRPRVAPQQISVPYHGQVESVIALCGLPSDQLAELLDVDEETLVSGHDPRLPERAKRVLDILQSVGATLGGGLGPAGVAMWLRAGEPSALALLKAGRFEEVQARIASFRGFPQDQ
jgi:hypothetical protein